MKLTVKLSKEEGLAFKNFTEMVKPPEISDDDFLKGIFKIGIETMEAKLMDAVQKHAAENNINLEEMREEAKATEAAAEPDSKQEDPKED